MHVPALDEAEGSSVRPQSAQRAGGAPAPPIFFETGLWFVQPEAEVLENRTIAFADGFGAYLTDEHTHEIYFDPAYDNDFLVAKHRAVIAEGHKLLYIPTRRGVFWELYDIEADPEETRNVLEEKPLIAARLRMELRKWMLSDPGMQPLGDYVVPSQP
jgi:hypothetical protein